LTWRKGEDRPTRQLTQKKTIPPWDLTRQDCELVQGRKELSTDPKLQFEDEEAIFNNGNRDNNIEGICRTIVDGLHAKYLYHDQTVWQD
jgi:hypothetical protein